MGTFKRVLIVDDDPILRSIAHSYFEGLGASDILQAANGREALEIVEKHGHGIDFILCDLNMPELDGVQFLRELKDHSFTGAIGILSGEDQLVVQTAHRLADSHNLNIVGALQKPLKKHDLDQLIAGYSPSKPKEATESDISVSASELGHAIVSGQIVPFYQPKIEVSSRKVVGAEALARWFHPQKGMVNPGDFIPIAEQCGLIGDLTNAILQRAMADLRCWQGNGSSIKVAINIAADLLHDLDFPDRLSTQIDAADLSPSDFVLEVTESGVLQRSSDPMEVLTRLRIKGFGLSIDDFGTGYSNIEQLSKFPFSELKIDRSFVQGARTDSLSKTVVDAAVLLGQELSMRLVAEGVETKSDWEFVAQHGIDEIQGFYVARPKPAIDFQRWYEKNNGMFVCPDDFSGEHDLRQTIHA